MITIDKIIYMLQSAIDSGNWILVGEALQLLLDFDEFQISDEEIDR